MNGSHGIPVDAYVATNKAAVVLNTGANQCQMIGNENTYFGVLFCLVDVFRTARIDT